MTIVPAGLAILFLAGAGPTLAPLPAAAQNKDRDLITRDEILASAQKDADLYTAIRSLRPNFLTGARGTTSLMKGRPQIAVYVDGGRRNGLEVLKQLTAKDVEEIRHLSPSQAETEYGVDHDAGAIVVKLYKGGQKPPQG